MKHQVDLWEGWYTVDGEDHLIERLAFLESTEFVQQHNSVVLICSWERDKQTN